MLAYTFVPLLLEARDLKMWKSALFALAILSPGAIVPAIAAEPIDLSGTYEYKGSLRNACVSKIEIQRVKGQHLVHVWFYGRPDDVDWGLVAAKEYRYAPAGKTPDLVATMQHGDAKAIVSIRVSSASNEKIHLLNVQSWLSYDHPDERHQNEAAQDTLTAKN